SHPYAGGLGAGAAGDLPLDVDGHGAGTVGPRALRKDTRRARAAGRQGARLRHGHRATAARAAGSCRRTRESAGFDAAQATTTADRLRDDAEGIRTAGFHHAVCRHPDRAATALSAEIRGVHAPAARGEPKAYRGVAGDAAATANGLRDDAVGARPGGTDMAARPDREAHS